MSNAGTAYVDFEGRFDGLLNGVQGALAPLTGKFGKLSKAAVVGLAGIGTAAIGAGALLFKVGESFDDAYDTIRVGTGKTGKALDGLKASFKNVVKDVPTDFGSASKAITQVNQRLGLTGKPLETLTEQFLELSRITETDLSTNIEAVTRLFGDWGVATKYQSGKLDELFRASQASGVPVARLAQIMTKFGGPLRQLGFDFGDAAAMAAKFEKEGVNTELVMGSMRIALGKMARDGEAPVETFRRMVKEIKNTGDAGKANALALELFGARAGPDMAAAIREGRFELDKMERTIRNGKDTIRGAGKDTQDFSEKWQMFKNRVLVVLEPIATRVFDAIGSAMDFISHISFRDIVDWFQDISRKGTTLGDVIATLQTIFEALKDAVVFVIGALQKAWDEFGDIFIAAAKNIYNTVKGLIGGVIETFKGIITFIRGVFSGDWRAAWDGIKSIFRGAWEAMKAIVTGIVNAIKEVVETAMRALAIAVAAVWEGIKQATTTAWNGIKALVDAAVDALIGFIRAIPGRLADFVGGIWNGIKTAFNAVKNAIADGVDAIVGFITGLPGRIAKAAIGMFNGIKDAFLGVYNWLKDRFEDIFGWMNDGDDKMDKLIAKAHKLQQSLGSALSVGLDSIKPPPAPNSNQQNGGGFGNTVPFRVVPSAITGTGTRSALALNPEIHVYIGDEELTDLVDLRVEIHDARTAAAVSGGVG